MANEPSKQNESPSDPVKPEGLLITTQLSTASWEYSSRGASWATHIRYLNDTSEGNIVSQVVFEEFSGRYNNVPLLQILACQQTKRRV